MANIRLIKRRIKSAKNIAQITKAMELVAAAKMKKAQAQALAGKLYAQKIAEAVLHVSAKVALAAHPLLRKPKKITGKRLIIVISTNKGLCGGLNNNLFRSMLSAYPQLKADDFVCLGKLGAEFLLRGGAHIIADFSSSISPASSVPALTELVTTKFISGSYDSVDLVFNEFISVSTQNPRSKTILPLTIQSALVESFSPQEQGREFLIEPSAREVMDLLLPHYLENQIRDASLQAEASEHSARMLAMHNATENALNLSAELTLLYNKARQEKITAEISDIVTARLAVESES